MNPIISKPRPMQTMGLGFSLIYIPPNSLFPQIHNLVLVILFPKTKIYYAFIPFEGHLLNRRLVVSKKWCVFQREKVSHQKKRKKYPSSIKL